MFRMPLLSPHGALLRLLLGTVAVCLFAGSPPSTGAQTPPADDPALLRELAVRLLTFSRSDTSISPQLFPGALPPAFPSTISLPPDSRLVGSAILPESGPAGQMATAIVVVADTGTAPADVLAFYQGLLTNAGWIPAPQNGFQPGGFLPFTPPGFASYCQGTSGPSLNISVEMRTGAPNGLRLQLTSPNLGLCNPQARPGPPPPFSQVLPALVSPAGVTIAPGGSSGGSDGSQQANAIARTDMSVAELERFYEPQLVAAGWTRTDGATQGPLAWSTWSVPGDKTRQGFLSVLDGPGPNERTLELRAATAGADVSGARPIAVTAPPPRA